MHFYLHILYIFCIFAAVLGIVPAITSKYLSNMKGKCIFRVCGGKEMCRVVARRNNDGGFYYVVFHGRKLAPTISRWSNVWDAVRAAEGQAACDMREVNEYVFGV